MHKQIIRSLVSDKELQKIIAKAEYDADEKKWRLPVFAIKENQVQLPKVPMSINNDKGKEEYRKQYFEEQKGKNRIVFQDQRNSVSAGGPGLEQHHPSPTKFHHSATSAGSPNENIQLRKSMSQTNYDKWKSLNDRRKSLQDYSPAPVDKMLPGNSSSTTTMGMTMTTGNGLSPIPPKMKASHLPDKV